MADKKEAGGATIASDTRGGAGEGQESPPAASGAQEGMQRGLDDPGFGRLKLPLIGQPVEKPLYASSASPSRAQKARHCNVLDLMSRCLDAVLDYPPIL